MTFAEEQASKWEEVPALGWKYEEGPRFRGISSSMPVPSGGRLVERLSVEVRSWVGCGVSYANFLCGVVEPIARHHAWVSSRRNVQSRENRGLDYAVKGEADCGEEDARLLFLR
jgi:hypothetical protein